MATTKPAQIRIRIPDEDGILLDQLGKGVLSRTDVATYILTAALEAIRKNPGRVNFPPVFEIGESMRESPGNYRLNEPAPHPKRK